MNHIKTRIGFLGYAEIEPSSWQFIHLEGGRNAAVGEVYSSEKELLSDLNRYASTWGDIGAEDQVVGQNEVLVRTTASIGYDVKWDIVPYVTDRWGDLVTDEDSSAGLTAAQEGLSRDRVIYWRLREMMRDAYTFIAHKDGQYGVLFEVEISPVATESSSDDCEQEAELPKEDTSDRLVGYAGRLEAAFPGFKFVVPSPSVVYEKRPALWVFVPLDGATADQLDAIFKALLDLAYPECGDTPSEASWVPNCEAISP